MRREKEKETSLCLLHAAFYGAVRVNRRCCNQSRESPRGSSAGLHNATACWDIITNYIILFFRAQSTGANIKIYVPRGERIIIGEILIRFSASWKKVGNGITRITQYRQTRAHAHRFRSFRFLSHGFNIVLEAIARINAGKEKKKKE